MKLPHVRPLVFITWLVSCMTGGALLGWLSGIPFWGSVAIVSFSLIINGVIAEVEDKAPGGFLNPRDKSK
ncbi:hypothetical protein [Vogesella indigofera]|uniref:hypothetical protein n=1 Tax=Vogesella indigofera TaxID=45465 RepID=UPI003F43FB1A